MYAGRAIYIWYVGGGLVVLLGFWGDLVWWGGGGDQDLILEEGRAGDG